MQIDSKILKQKIDEYYKKNISKNELGRWAKEGYYALMKGEYLEIEKLEIVERSVPDKQNRDSDPG